MPTLDVDITVKCDCGKNLTALSRGYQQEVTVEACPDCLANTRKQGYNEGYDEGMSDA